MAKHTAAARKKSAGPIRKGAISLAEGLRIREKERRAAKRLPQKKPKRRI